MTLQTAFGFADADTHDAVANLDFVNRNGDVSLDDHDESDPAIGFDAERISAQKGECRRSDLHSWFDVGGERGKRDLTRLCFIDHDRLDLCAQIKCHALSRVAFERAERGPFWAFLNDLDGAGHEKLVAG